MATNKVSFFLTSLLATQITLAGGYPLHKAVRYGEVETLRKLLHNGANPNVFDRSGKTPLDCAINKRNLPCAALLIKYGAKITISNKTKKAKNPLYYATTNRHKSTFLHILAQKNYVKELTVFLTHGANPNLTNKHKRTLLHAAAQFGHTEIVKILLEHKANPNLQADYNDQTRSHLYSVIDLAIIYNHLGVLETLLHSTACFITKNHAHQTALHLAQQRGNRAIIRLLETIQNGVDKFIANPLDFEPQEYCLTNSSKNFVSIEELPADFFLKQLYYAMDEKECKNSFINVAIKFIQAGKKDEFDALVKDCNFDSDTEKKRHTMFTKIQRKLVLYTLVLKHKKSNDMQFKF